LKPGVVLAVVYSDREAQTTLPYKIPYTCATYKYKIHSQTLLAREPLVSYILVFGLNSLLVSAAETREWPH